MRSPDMLKWIIGMSYNTQGVGLPESSNTLQLRVPFVHQDHVNLCGDAAALMIAKFWNLDTTVNTSVNPRAAFDGSNVSDHKRITTFGMLKWEPVPGPAVTNTWTSAELRDHLATRGPLACSLAHSRTIPIIGYKVEWGHWIVLCGVDTATNTLAYHDPWRGQYKMMSLADLNRDIDWPEAECAMYLAGVGT